jgi:PAS domain S-box-containing protein
MPSADREHLLAELQLHQAELEVQNEELRRTRDELQAAHDRYFDLFELAPVGYLTIGRRPRILSANLTAAAFLGVPRDRLVGRAFPAFLEPDEADRFHKHQQAVFADWERKHTLELRVRRADGDERMALIEAAAYAEAGEPRCRMAIMDVTEGRRAEALLREREASLRETLTRFQQIADRIEDIFYIVEPSSGRLVYVSPAFAVVFRRSLDEIEAAGSWMAWVHPDDRPRVQAALARAGRAFDEEYRIVRPDGSERRVRDRGYPLAGQDRLTGIIHDVTEERQLEAGLRHAQRLETVGTLASGIAHDFNNLLMGLAGLGNMALHALEPGHPAAGYVRRAVEATMRGKALTRQLLDFSGQKRASATPIALDPVVLAARELIDRLVGDHIRVSIETNAAGVSVVAEPGEIEQILLNLVSNAGDAMPAGGDLTVRTEAVDGRLALSVRDTGQGMDARTRERVFEPFFTTKEVGRGTGLGLSTVFALARQRGGEVAIASEVGQGTVVTVSLPIAPRDADQDRRAQEEPTGEETILVVEDDALVRATVESYVAALGYRALMAENVEDALRLAGESRPIDLLLTDVVMPGRLGGDLAREIASIRAGLPVLFMSAHPRAELERLGRLGADSRLLAKPFDRRDLSLALRAALDEATPAGAKVLIVDDNRELAATLQELLEETGCSAVVAHSGEEALRLADELRPALMICDLQLGAALSGNDVVRALRASDELRGTSVVALTGLADPATAAAALEAGFDAVVTKPLDLGALEGLVQRPPRRRVPREAARAPAKTAK